MFIHVEPVKLRAWKLTSPVPKGVASISPFPTNSASFVAQICASLDTFPTSGMRPRETIWLRLRRSEFP